jgi:hypothetical protein
LINIELNQNHTVKYTNKGIIRENKEEEKEEEEGYPSITTIN